jgi:hypothetical protein
MGKGILALDWEFSELGDDIHIDVAQCHDLVHDG